MPSLPSAALQKYIKVLTAVAQHASRVTANTLNTETLFPSRFSTCA